MKASLLALLLSAALLFCANNSFGQGTQPYFSTLNSVQYKEEIKQLKARNASVRYTNKKDQSTYASFVK